MGASSPVRQQGGPRRSRDYHLSISSKLRQSPARRVNEWLRGIGAARRGAEAGGAEGVRTSNRITPDPAENVTQDQGPPPQAWRKASSQGGLVFAQPPGDFLAPLQWAPWRDGLHPAGAHVVRCLKSQPVAAGENQLRRCLSSSLSMRPPCSFVFPGAGAARLATNRALRRAVLAPVRPHINGPASAFRAFEPPAERRNLNRS